MTIFTIILGSAAHIFNNIQKDWDATEDKSSQVGFSNVIRDFTQFRANDQLSGDCTTTLVPIPRSHLINTIQSAESIPQGLKPSLS